MFAKIPAVIQRKIINVILDDRLYFSNDISLTKIKFHVIIDCTFGARTSLVAMLFGTYFLSRDFL